MLQTIYRRLLKVAKSKAPKPRAEEPELDEYMPPDVQYSTELGRCYVRPDGDFYDCVPRIRNVEADIEINREAFRRWQLQQAKK